ncbi:Zn-ribbon domain-containing OB-fold protein [Paraburkholderia adhaesiva]|uniref:Zn-ribbon domain-containing OB-fold protein n=1 Tax=Paraburkholderia adhaesiva TaxID=2883244 RepID=UPI001F2D08AD|nr:zinc ribbon domain-containing protein [Paraburkholderia adhaesiva]
MSETTLTIFRCRACGEALFPARYRCPRCGAADWKDEAAPSGVIEESTVVRHRVGALGAGDIHLASVRTEAGAIVIARLDVPGRTGEPVLLTIDDAKRVLARPR